MKNMVAIVFFGDTVRDVLKSQYEDKIDRWIKHGGEWTLALPIDSVLFLYDKENKTACLFSPLANLNSADMDNFAKLCDRVSYD